MPSVCMAEDKSENGCQTFFLLVLNMNTYEIFVLSELGNFSIVEFSFLWSQTVMKTTSVTYFF